MKNPVGICMLLNLVKMDQLSAVIYNSALYKESEQWYVEYRVKQLQSSDLLVYPSVLS